MEKIIKLSGRIDSTNIGEIEKNVMDDIKDFDGEIIFDAKELEYISSAGLRMILKVKKKNDDMKVINCNTEVYDVFNMTGFTEMMDITKVFRELSVDGCEVIGDGFFGTVYRYNPEIIVKVYKKPDSLEMVKREKELSRKAFVLGIPTAIPFDIVKVGDKYGSVFELLNCKSLDKCIKDGEDIEPLVKECVKILNKMHTTELKTSNLPKKKNQIIGMARACEGYLSEEIIEDIVTFINNISDADTLIHGDFHIKNLMKQDDEILLIDMDTLSTGNPIFEFGALFATYEAFSCVNKNNSMEFLGISFEQSKQIWDCLFNTYYKDKSDNEKEKLMDQIKILSYLEVLFLRAKFPDENNKYKQEEIDFCKEYLTNNIKKVNKESNNKIHRKKI